MRVGLKRIYEPKSEEDGLRVLVDRLWPRGLGKKDAAIDLWLKEVAPSPQLRRWFGHDPGKWTEFRRRYERELRDNAAAVTLLRQAISGAAATLLYAARDEKHNHAIVLRDFVMD